MRNFKKFGLLMFLAGMLLSGCAAGFMDHVKATMEHGPRYGYPDGSKTGQTATISFMRYDWPTAKMQIYLAVTLDGKHIYNMKANETITFEIEAGEHTFGVIGPEGPTKWHQIPVACEAGKAYNLLVWVHHFIPPTIETVDKFPEPPVYN